MCSTQHWAAAVRAPLVRCSRCGVVFDAARWQQLVLLERIGSDHVRTLVTSWRDDVSIEVRTCVSCGDPIARKTSVSPSCPGS
jgi:hypothetical protein